MFLFLALAAASDAQVLTCDALTDLVVRDVPEPEILEALVASLDEGVPTGAPSCFRRLRLPPPAPIHLRDGALAYLVELHQRFPCDPSVLSALRQHGIVEEAPRCLMVPAHKPPPAYWPPAARDRLRRQRARR